MWNAHCVEKGTESKFKQKVNTTSARFPSTVRACVCVCKVLCWMQGVINLTDQTACYCVEEIWHMYTPHTGKMVTGYSGTLCCDFPQFGVFSKQCFVMLASLKDVYI